MDHMTAMEHMPAMKHMPSSDQNINPLPINDTKTPTDEQMDAKNQNRETRPYYNTEEELMAASIFIKYFGDYRGPLFYENIGQLQKNLNIPNNY